MHSSLRPTPVLYKRLDGRPSLKLMKRTMRYLERVVKTKVVRQTRRIAWPASWMRWDCSQRQMRLNHLPMKVETKKAARTITILTQYRLIQMKILAPECCLYWSSKVYLCGLPLLWVVSLILSFITRIS